MCRVQSEVLVLLVVLNVALLVIEDVLEVLSVASVL